MRGLGLGCLLVALASSALAQPSDKLKGAVRMLEAGRCEQLRDVINTGLAAGDRDLYYLAGFMFARGKCVAQDGVRAAKLLETAAKAAQPDAALELVLMHGMGRGLAQSYAQAGRWALAAQDIGALSACPLPAPTTCAGPRTLDADYAASLGYVGTIHALVNEHVRDNSRQYTRQLESATSVVTVRVTVVWPDKTLRIATAANDGVLKDASVRYQSGTKGVGVMVKSAYEGAIEVAPPAPCVRATCAPVESTMDYGFRLE